MCWPDGGAVVLLEPVCSGDTLYQTTQDLLAAPQRRQAMAQAMEKMGIPDAAEKIMKPSFPWEMGRRGPRPPGRDTHLTGQESGPGSHMLPGPAGPVLEGGEPISLLRHRMA